MGREGPYSMHNLRLYLVVLVLVLCSALNCFAQRVVKQSTAYELKALMIDSSDHIAGKTGLTLTITLCKTGETSFSSISPTVTANGNGVYSIFLTTSHLDTVGDTAVHVTASGADPFDAILVVRPQVLGDTLSANALQWASVNTASDDIALKSTLAKGSDLTGFNDITAAQAWEYSTRELTSANGIVLNKGTEILGFNDPSEAQIWEYETRILTGADNLTTPITTAVWINGTRTLSSGANIVLAKGTGITGFNDITAASVWTNVTRSLTDKTGYGLSSTTMQDLHRANPILLVERTVEDGNTGSVTLSAPDDYTDPNTLVGAAFVVDPGSSGPCRGFITSASRDGDNIVLTLSTTLPTSPVGATFRIYAALGSPPAEVWTNSVRSLTTGSGIVLAKGIGLTGLNDLSPQGIVDASKLAPTAGVPAAGSPLKTLDIILKDVNSR